MLVEAFETQFAILDIINIHIIKENQFETRHFPEEKIYIGSGSWLWTRNKSQN